MVGYNRERAVAYARRHALVCDHSRCGTDGDASAFVSRCIAAGLEGFPELADAEQLYRYLLECGLARICTQEELAAGDLVQLQSSPNAPYKSLLVTGGRGGEQYVCGHSYQSLERPLASYRTAATRCLSLFVPDAERRK